MKKILFAIIVILTACRSKPPLEASDNIEIMFPFGDTTFNWKGIEKEDDNLKAMFKKQAPILIKEEYDNYQQGEPKNLTDLKGNCHIVDFNNDGLNDIIFTGPTGGEEFEVNIFLNTPSGLKSVLKRNEFIKKLEFKNHRLFRIYIQDTGCCDEYIDFNSVYEVSYEGAVPHFRVVYLTANMDHSYMPKKYFDKPIHFVVMDDKYKMRMTPNVADTVIDDFSFPGRKFKTENIIDTLVKGTKGRAIASQTDNTGRIWWFAEIDSAYKKYGHSFYEQRFDPKLRSSRMGWISSRFVKQVAQ